MRRTKISEKVRALLSLVVLLGGAALLGGCAGSNAGPQPQTEVAQSSGSRGSGDEVTSVQSAPASSPPAPQGFPSFASENAPTSAAPASVAPASPPPPPTTAGSSKKSQVATADARPAPQSAPGAAERAPEPSTRPGLGTEFGESRVSRVHDVSFVRDSSRPFAISSMNYNDKRGVDALANSAGVREVARGVSAASGAITISIRDAEGNSLETRHIGDRTLVVGQAGQRYSIVLENHTSHRFEAVGTVDGLDVVNGKPGTFDNRGYVLLPFATVTIDGFRTSTASVAAFRFAAVADSYAAQTGSARNVGVIGIAFFSERGDAFVPDSETRLRENASPFPADPRFAQPPRR